MFIIDMSIFDNDCKGEDDEWNYIFTSSTSSLLMIWNIFPSSNCFSIVTNNMKAYAIHINFGYGLKMMRYASFFRRKLHKIEIKNTFGSHFTTIWCLFMPKGDVRSGCFVWRRRWESFFLHFVTSLYLLKLDLHEGWNKCLFYLKEIISKDSKGSITFISTERNAEEGTN